MGICCFTEIIKKKIHVFLSNENKIKSNYLAASPASCYISEIAPGGKVNTISSSSDAV